MKRNAKKRSNTIMSMSPMVFSNERKAEILNEIDPMIDPLLQTMGIEDDDVWEMKFVRNGITCFESVKASKYHRLCLSSCTIASTLESAMSSMATDTTAALLRAERAILGDRLESASVITVLRPRTKKTQQHYVGIKWMSYSSNGDGQGCFDGLYCDAVGMGHTSDGRRSGYRIIRSIVIPECPSMEQFGMPRGHIGFNIFKFKETLRPDILEMSVSVNLLWDDPASLSSLFDPYPQTNRYREYIEDYYLMDTRLYRSMHTFTSLNSASNIPYNKSSSTSQFTKHGGKDKRLSVPQKLLSSGNYKKTNCQLCSKTFRWYRTRHTCFECGNTVCHHCYEHISIARTKRKICLVCQCSSLCHTSIIRNNNTHTVHSTTVHHNNIHQHQSPSKSINPQHDPMYRSSISSNNSMMDSDRGSWYSNMVRKSANIRSSFVSVCSLGSTTPRDSCSGSMHKQQQYNTTKPHTKNGFTFPWYTPKFKSNASQSNYLDSTRSGKQQNDFIVDELNRSSVCSITSIEDWNPIDMTARNSIPFANDTWTPIQKIQS